jgi:hypothetical protein
LNNCQRLEGNWLFLPEGGDRMYFEITQSNSPEQNSFHTLSVTANGVPLGIYGKAIAAHRLNLYAQNIKVFTE